MFSLLFVFLRFLCSLPKVFTNHLCFHTVKQYNFPIKITWEAFPKDERDGVSNHPLDLSHTLNKGFPHNPGFPSNKLFGNVSNKLFGNVSNYFLYSIDPVKWLSDTLKNAREVKDPRCLIILLVVR